MNPQRFNPLINNFNNYNTNNPNIIPFQTNQLINQNVHVMNNLNNFIRQHDNVKQNMGTYQQQVTPVKRGAIRKNNTNIIEDMLKPQKILKDNKDIESNYQAREHSRTEKIKRTNDPYKNIIKDHVINKKVRNAKELIVHTVTDADKNRKNFDTELTNKKNEKKEINKQIKLDFHIDNYSSNKEKFEFKESFIKNLAYNSNAFNENKEDYIDFYRKHQKEAEEGQNLCDKILHNMIDTGLIKPEELPSDINIDSQSID